MISEFTFLKRFRTMKVHLSVITFWTYKVIGQWDPLFTFLNTHYC